MMRPVLIILGIVFLGCSPAAMRVYDSTYDRFLLQNKTLVLVLRPKSIAISNPSDVNDDLGQGIPKEVYETYFRKTLAGYLRSYSVFGTSVSDDSLQILPTRVQTLDVSDQWQIKLHLPPEGDPFLLKHQNADFVLWIESVDTDRDGGAGAIEGDTGESYGGVGEALRQRIIYGLWDNRKGHLVTYGRCDIKVGILAFVTKETWDQGIQRIAQTIIEKTPLQKTSQ